MQAWMILPYFVLWATLANALFVKAQLVPAACAACGRRHTAEDTSRCKR